MQENQPNNTDAAAQAAITEQQHGDEFKAQTPPDVHILVDEYNTLDAEISDLTQRLYGSFMGQMDGTFKQPPYLERERMRITLEKKETRMWQVREELRGYALQMGGIE